MPSNQHHQSTNNDDDDDAYSSYYDVQESPRDLIAHFVTILQHHAERYRELMKEQYNKIIRHIPLWFKEKGHVDLLSVEGIDDVAQVCHLIQEEEEPTLDQQQQQQ